MRKAYILVILLLPLFVQPSMAADLTNSTLTANTTSVSSGGTVVLTVHAENSTNNLQVGAVVSLSVNYGSFVNNNFDSYDPLEISNLTDISGEVQVTWIAPQLNTSVSSLTVSFTAIIGIQGASTTLFLDIKVADDADAIANSQIIAPTTVGSNETFNISTYVKAIDDTPRSGMQVEYSIANGELESGSLLGESDSNGFYNISWRSPELSSEVPTVDIEITVVITYNASISLTLQKNVTAAISSASTLTVDDHNPDEVNEGSTTELSFEVKLDGAGVSGASIYIEATNGTFVSDNTIQGTTNLTGFFNANWTAPSVNDIEISEVNFTVDVLYVNVSHTEEFSIDVVPVLGNLNISISTNGTQFVQDEVVGITVTVLDNTTSTPVQGAFVSLTSDLGSLDEIGLTTDVDGKATASLSFKDSTFTVTLQTVTIEANVTALEYHAAHASQSIVVEEGLSLSEGYEVSYLNTSYSVGQTITFLVNATYSDGTPIAGAAFKVTASAGLFENGEMTTINSTGTDGLLLIVWDSSSINVNVSSYVVYFEFTPTSFSNNATAFGITLSTGQTQSNPELGGVNGALIGAGIAAGGLAGAGIAVVIIRRRP